MSAFRKLVLAATTLLIMVVGVEGILRVTHLGGARLSWTEPDHEIGWRFSPAKHYWYHKENDYPISGRINAHGWRDSERTLDKPAGGARVAVLGDSFVEGFQVERHATFPALVEAELGDGVEVMNFGRAGMSQTEELIVLERDIVRFDPDVLVLVFVPQNDVRDVAAATAVNPMRPFYRAAEGGELELDLSFATSPAFHKRVRINPLKQNSALVSLALERFNAMKQSRRAARLAALQSGATTMPAYLSLCTTSPNPELAANYELVKRLLAAVADRCAAAGIDMILVTNYTAYMPRRITELRAIDASFDPAWYDDDLGRWCAERGIAHVGLQAPFAARAEATGDKLHWEHWTYDGHATVAEAVLPALRRRLGR